MIYYKLIYYYTILYAMIIDTSEAGALFNLLDDDQSGTIHFEELKEDGRSN